MDYTPENTEDTLYILKEIPMSEVLKLIKGKWGFDVNLENIRIESDYIHTRCLTYDLYDPSDYDEYIVITHYKEN